MRALICNYAWFKFSFFLSIIVVIAGCCSLQAGEDASVALQSDHKSEKVLAVSEVYENLGNIKGKIVEVSGRFMGWAGCRNKTKMMTRSDWVLAGDNVCIYVTGGTPSGLDPANKGHKGRHVRIRAMVIHMDGYAYLKLIDRSNSLLKRDSEQKLRSKTAINRQTSKPEPS